MFDVTFSQTKCFDFGQFSCFRFGRNELTERNECRIDAGNTWIAITWMWFDCLDGMWRPLGHIPMCSISFTSICLLTHNRFRHFVVDRMHNRWIGIALTIIHLLVHCGNNEKITQNELKITLPRSSLYVRRVEVNECNWHHRHLSIYSRWFFSLLRNRFHIAFCRTLSRRYTLLCEC